MGLSYLRILLAVLLSASHLMNGLPVKEKPDFGPEIKNEELKAITDEYFKLSARNHIKFDKNVTIGFSSIPKDSVIGTCSYRETFREIDLDKEYWQDATWHTKIALVFHELTHCYCERSHDFGEGEMYPDGSLRYLFQKFLLRLPFSPLKPRGYMADNCPESIMHPVVLSNACFEKHYSHYVHEMFERCKAW